MSGASFVFPPDGDFSEVAPSGTVNIFDTLEVSYTSPWSALNLTLFCLVGDSTTDYQVWNAPDNPMAPTGTYRLDSIDSTNFNIIKFPAPCSFKLTKYGDNNVARGGENFRLVSIQGTSTTYSSTSISTSTSSSSVSSRTTTTTDLAASPPSLTTGSASQSNTSTASASHPSSSSSPTTSTSPSVSSSSVSPTSTSEPAVQAVGLSTAARAGIGIGIALLLLIIVTLCFVVFRLRRRVNRPAQADLQKLSPELPAYVFTQDHKATFQSSVQELDSSNRSELFSEHAGKRPSELQ